MILKERRRGKVHHRSVCCYFIIVIVLFVWHVWTTFVPLLNSPVISVSKPETWTLEVTNHQQRYRSQGGQDGSLDWIFRHIHPKNKFFVEFGFSTPGYEWSIANTRHLYEKGWRGLLLDGRHSNSEINLQTLWITPETIVEELKARGVPEGTDYISVDIDSSDCFVVLEIACKLKPRVLTVEYNSNFPFESTLANIGKDYIFLPDRLFGCSLKAVSLVARECGYSIVDVVPWLDAILVRDEELHNLPIPPLERWKTFTGMKLHPAGRPVSDAGKYLCDFEVYLHTRNLADCTGDVALKQVTELNIDLDSSYNMAFDVYIWWALWYCFRVYFF